MRKVKIFTAGDLTIKTIFNKNPEVSIPPFMRIRQYVASLLLKADGNDVKLPSERKLCDLFGVTRPTVRKALKQLVDSGDLLIKPGLGTFINPLKKLNVQAAYNQCHKICVIFHTGGLTHINYYFWALFNKAASHLIEQNTLLHILNLCYKDEKAAEEIAVYQPDGVLWFAPPFFMEKTIVELKRRNIPVMLVNASFPNLPVDYVRFDYEALGYEAGKYFVERGHRQALFIALKKDEKYDECFKGFSRAFEESERALEPKYSIKDNDDIETEVYRHFKYGGSVKAVFSFSSYFTTVCKAVKKAGVDPKEVDIATEDSPITKRSPEFNVKRIHEPLDDIGLIAAEKLLEKLKSGSDKQTTLILKPEE